MIAPAPSGRLSGLCLLLVEDNEINRELARGILQRAGARVAVATDGQAAVTILERQPARFHAVLMDLRMPVMDGCEATRAIRGRLGLSLPVVAMTAAARPEDREEARRAGMDAHVAKPIDPEELVSTLERLTAGQGGPAPSLPPATGPAMENQPDLPPDLPGIDLRTALIRLGGDRRLWISLMGQFEATQGGVVAEVRRSLAAGRDGEAAQALHRLRGVAANLGAVDVARLAAEAEAAVKDRKAAALPAFLEQLEAAMASVCVLARRLPEPAPAADEAPSVGDLEAGLDELGKFLAANNLRALSLFEKLRPALAATAASATIQSLAGALERLDFAAAERLVADIRKNQSEE